MEDFFLETIMEGGRNLADGLLNLAADLSLTYGLIQPALLGFGLVLVTGGFLAMSNGKRANGDPRMVSIGNWMIVGGVLCGIFYELVDATLKTFDPFGQLASPLDHLETAKGFKDIQPFMAMLYAVLSLVSLVAWFYLAKAFALVFRTGSSADKGGYLWSLVKIGFASLVVIQIMDVWKEAVLSWTGVT